MDNELERQVSIANLSKLIELKPTTSSNVAGIGYDETHQLLKVAFKHKDSYTTYVYENVEPEIFERIVESESVGKTLRECVTNNKDKYNYIKL